MRTLALAALVFALACDKNDAGATSDDVARYAGEYADSVAAAWSSCQGSTLDVGRAAAMTVVMDRDAYVARQAQLFRAGAVRFDASAGRACLAAVRDAATCGAVFDARFDPAGACRRALVGEIPPGGACTASAQCANGRCDTSATCPGVCAPRIPEGGACSLAMPCVDGATCIYPGSFPGATVGTCRRNDLRPGEPCGLCRPDLACVSGTCQPVAAVGAACGATPCSPRAYCDGTTCVQRPVIGAACSAATPCQLGAYCAGGTCVAFGGPGAPCGSVPDAGGYVGCAPGSWCRIAAGATAGTCSALVGYGAACTSTDRCEVLAACNGSAGHCVEACPP